MHYVWVSVLQVVVELAQANFGSVSLNEQQKPSLAAQHTPLSHVLHPK